MNSVQRGPFLVPKAWISTVLSQLAIPFKPRPRFMLAEYAHPTVCSELRNTTPLVLVVDDDPFNLLFASSLLARYGITPLLAADGAKAVALACSHNMDLILMDLQMPVLNGLAATKQIRRFELANCRERAPVVAYTSSPLGEDEPLLQECGLDAVLGKPCDEESLERCLFRWCPDGTRNSKPRAAMMALE